MWLSDIDFDGQEVSGVLLNAPNWLTSVQEGDAVRLPLGHISDWMYVIGGEVYGAYTVNLMRSRMGRAERAEHDAAWGGLDFGDPTQIRVVPQPSQGGGFLKNWFGKQQTDIGEHPASENIAGEIQKQLAQDPSLVHVRDDNGWTFLHHEALAGSLAPIKVLLAAGADPRAVTNHGLTPLQLARSLGWENVVALLTARN
jgi:ankyrin repeat protein